LAVGGIRRQRPRSTARHAPWSALPGRHRVLQRGLLGTTALVSLAVGTAGPASAGCYTGPYPFTNNTTRSCLTVSHTSFAGNVVNAGTLQPTTFNTGILVISSTITGQVSNAGTITNGFTDGINVETNAVITNGIVNTGQIKVTDPSNSSGIQIGNTATFAGGIDNATGGSITAAINGVLVLQVSTFSGGITNTGLISNGSAGLHVNGVDLFVGNISNGGTVTGGHSGIRVDAITSFAGSIINSNFISSQTGIKIGPDVIGAVVVNTGTVVGTVAAIDTSLNTSPAAIDQQGGLLSGKIMLSTNADVLNVSGGSIAGNIVGAGSSNTIDFGLGAGNTFTYGSTFSLTGINQVNVTSGTVILDGQNHATNIAVTGGNLEVGDAANTSAALVGTVNVTGGILSGHGTVVGAVTIGTGGTLAPGGSIGTLTVGGPLTFNAGSSYGVQLTPAGTNSATNVISTASLTGGTVVVTPQPGSYGAHIYTILTTGGGLGGTTFAGLAVNGAFMGTLTLDYTTNPGDVDVDVNTLPTNATSNQRNVGNAITNAVMSGVTLPPGFQTVFGLPGNQLLGALDQLSGEAATGAELSSFQLMSQYLGLLTGPFGQGHVNGFGSGMAFAPQQEPALPPEVASAYAAVLKAPPAPTAPRYSIWAAPFGGTNTDRGDPFTVGSHDVTTRTGGFAAGVDYRLSPDTVAGFSLAGGGTSWSLSAGLGGGSSDVFLAGLYGSHQIGPAYVSGALAFADYWMKTSRTVTVAGTDTLTASFNAQDVGARLEGGYHIENWLPFRLTPYVAAQAQAFRSPTYGETAASGSAQFALSYNGETVSAERAEVGDWVDKTFALADRQTFTLFGRGAYAHDWVSNPALTPTFLGLPTASFVVNGAPAPHDLALATLGAEVRWGDGWSLMARFDGELGDHSETYTGTARLRYAW
jgi:uncharacterized protein with beta-barrel porin domain